LKKQVRGVLGAVGAIKDTTVPRVRTSQPHINNTAAAAAAATGKTPAHILSQVAMV